MTQTPTGQDALPVTVLLPDAAAMPITLYDSGAALRMAVVERDGVQALDTDWDKPGVYVLLDLHEQDGSWGCYVGKAAAGVRSRLLQHVAKKDHWRRALLIQRDTTFGFNSAQVGWLEGRLYDLLDAAGDAKLHNGNRPSDETLPAHERLVLEASVAPIRRILRLIGYDPSSPGDQVAAPGLKRSSRFYGITVQQIIAAGLLHGGENLTSTNGAWPATATLRADGTVDISGTTYGSPSAAATAVKQGPANGWEFWAVDTPTGAVSLATLRARYAVQQPQAAPPGVP